MLTVVQIRALQPGPRPFKVFDSDGLYLLVQPSGALLWRFRYRCCGIERKLSLGSFPDVSLQQARRARDVAKAELDDGVDPVEEKRQKRLQAELAAKTTFELVANEYIEKMEREGSSVWISGFTPSDEFLGVDLTAPRTVVVMNNNSSMDGQRP
jgi:hypothetical protein